MRSTAAPAAATRSCASSLMTPSTAPQWESPREQEVGPSRTRARARAQAQAQAQDGARGPRRGRS
jgi:hypothetical protein